MLHFTICGILLCLDHSLLMLISEGLRVGYMTDPHRGHGHTNQVTH